MFILGLLAVAIGNTSSTENATNPLAYAEKGLSQCWHADPIRRTCRVLSSYQKTGPQTYDETAIVLVSSNGPLTVETQTPVVVRGDAVCATIRAQEVKAGTFREGGHIVAPAEATGIARQIVQKVLPFEGQETCARYERSGDDFIAKVSLSGKYKSELDANVKWIAPADGYSVGP